MANNANEENPFQDLLSAALSESGLTDDFDLSGFGVEDQHVGGQHQVLGAQRQPVVAQRQPLAGQRPAVSIQSQPLLGQQQSLGTQRQPLALQRQVITVQRQSPGVQRQILTAHRQLGVAQRQPLVVQNTRQQTSQIPTTVRAVVGQSSSNPTNIVRPGSISTTPVVRVNARGQPVVQAGSSATPTIRVQAGVHTVRPVTTTVSMPPVTLDTLSQHLVLNTASETPQRQSPLVSTSKFPTPQGTNTPVSSNVKKSIIHIVTPKNATGVASHVSQGVPTVKRVLQLSSTGQSIVSSPNALQQQGTKPGAIKVIQIGANKLCTTGAKNSVTLSGGDGRTYKIVTIKSPSVVAGQDATGQKITLSTDNTPGSSLPRNVVKMLPEKGGGPLRATIVTAGAVITAGSTGISTSSLAMATRHGAQVMSSQTTISPSVSQVRTTAGGQPFVIKTPILSDGTSQPGKTITKVLKIIKPSVSASIPTTEGHRNTKIVHVSTPVIYRNSNSSRHPPVNVVPIQTSPSSGTTLPVNITSSQASNIVALSKHSATTASFAVSSGASPVFRIAGANEQTPVSTSAIMTKISTAPVQIVTSTSNVIQPVSLDEIVASKTEDEKMALDALNFLSDSKPDLTQNIVPKAESKVGEPVLISGKPKPMDTDIQDIEDVNPVIGKGLKSEIKGQIGAFDQNHPAINNIVKEEMKTEVKEEEKTKVKEEEKTDKKEEVKTEVKEEVKVEVMEEVKADIKEEVKAGIKEGVKAGIKEEVKAGIKEEVKADIKEEVKTEFDENPPTVATQEVKTDIKEDVKEEPACEVSAATEETGNGDWGLFEGSGDLDLFSQALQQLSETNEKAKEYEQEEKKKHISEPDKPTVKASPQVVSQQNLLKTAAETSNIQPTVTQEGVGDKLTGYVTINLQNRDGGSGRSSPSIIQLTQPGRVQSPVTLVQRVGSPLTLSRPGSPQVFVQQQGGVSVLHTLGQTMPRHSTVYTTSNTPSTSLTPGSSLRRISTLPQIQTSSTLCTTPTGKIIRQVMPSGTRISVPAGTPIPGAQPIVVGSVNQMSLLGMSKTEAPGNGVLPLKLTDKVVSQLWANDDLKLKKIATAPILSQLAAANSPMPHRTLVDEEMEAEDEDLGHAETYAEYMPSKLNIGLKHPDSVVETSSLSSVESANVFYKLSIPEHIIDSGALSALQLETIVYASQKHETLLPSGERAGFLVGDGAGVGKGRTIAGIIYENYLQGRKRSLWLSVSNDLKVDAERDLHDIGAGKIEVHPLNKFKYAKISSHINNSVKKGVIFATYSSLIGESQAKGKYRTRLKQLLHWAGKDFDGTIIFDECHRAKNLFPVGSSKPTKTGLTVVELQRKLPKARIVYASATGASEPRNMAYMTRLGMWGPGTPFREFTDFIQAIEKRGVGAMELVAMDMKLRGMYIARQLSFHGVTFNIKEIEIPTDFVQIYNAAVRLWVEAREKFQKAAELISAEQRMRKTMWGQFWSAHQRFFKYLCISAKVKHCIKIARDAIKNGKCVVIGLQSTGEARTLEQLEECGGELNDFVSTAKGVLQAVVEKHFPAPDRKKTMDLFGWNSSIFDDSPAPSPKSSKRKKGQHEKDKKRAKTDWSDDSSSSSSSASSGSEDETMDTKATKSSKSPSEESDLSLSESSSEQSDADSDNFNPFGNGSDSDDDPWLKKTKKNKEKKKRKLPKENKEKKEEPKKAKKRKKDKKKKEKKPKKPDPDSDDELDDIDSQLDKMLVAAGLKKSDTKGGTEISSQKAASKDCVQEAIDMKRELLMKVDKLGDRLPPNTLDELIDQLGGPEFVAEMTGRKGRVVSNDDGLIQYESRSESDTPLELMNLAEKQRFMDGEKFIAIISEAASSGISLQADRRVRNQRRRVHITLELPWSADRAVQQFGRTHRSNQVSAPEYLFLISQLAGERRFASTVAKRLESLGALTHGDRRATETRDLSRFNIDNKFGRAALETVMKSVLQQEVPLVQPPESYVGNFFGDVKRALIGVGMIAVDEMTGYAVLEKEYNNISKFLNRILGMEVEVQNELFKYFTDTLAEVILQAKRNGRWDMGILDLGTGNEEVRMSSTKTFKGNFAGVNTKITLYTISIERGMTWQKALEVWREHDGTDDGFYLSRENYVGKTPPVLAIALVGRKRERLYRLYRPNSGIQSRMESLEDLKKKYKKVYPDDARYWWEDQYDSSLTCCTHAYWRGSCRRASVGLTCETGLRRRTYHVLSGSVLSVWTKVESVLASTPGGIASRMQIIRLRTEDGKKIVGTLIPDQALPRLEQMLSNSAAESPQKHVTYMPHQPRPGFTVFPPATMVPPRARMLTSLPNVSTLKSVSSQSTGSALSSVSLLPSVSTQSVSSQPKESTPKQYLSMPMFL